MKLLGHAWVAVNAYPRGNRRLLILGSILPEIMYYTKKHPFDFEETHEGGDRVYQYLKDKKSDWTDLGLGMLAHSAKAGADKYNIDENLALLGYEGDRVDELRTRLSEVLGITYERAKIWAHNILQLAIELKIIRQNPDFVKEFNEAIADKDTKEEIKRILADCFQKDPESVFISVDELFDKAKPEYFKDAEGLANLWSELSREFGSEFDREKLAELLQGLSAGYGNRDEVFLRECINWTKVNLERVSAGPERGKVG